MAPREGEQPYDGFREELRQLRLLAARQVELLAVLVEIDQSILEAQDRIEQAIIRSVS